MGGKGGDQTVTQMPDVGTQRYWGQSGGPRDIARRYAHPMAYGMDLAEIRKRAGEGFFPGATEEWRTGFAGLQGIAENLGFGGGDPMARLGQFYNPYEETVIGGLQSDYDRQRALMGQNVAQEATRAGAFGGDRATVMRMMGERDIGESEARQLGQLRYTGFGDAYSRMMEQAGMGMNLAQQMMGGGEYLRALQERYQQEPIWRAQQAMNLYNLGLGPYGTTSRSEQPGNWLGQMMGAVPLIGSLF